jgi:hypothetical protein
MGCRDTVSQLGITSLPAEVPAGAAEDDDFLKSVHELVLDVCAVPPTPVAAHQQQPSRTTGCVVLNVDAGPRAHRYT